MYQAKAAVCSEIRAKSSMQSGYHVEFLIVKPGGKQRNHKALNG
jgi:hypothetical protein